MIQLWLLLASLTVHPGVLRATEAAAATSGHAAALAQAQQQQQQQGVGLSWFVQLTDLHLNKFTHPDILPDLLAFGDQVLSGVRPQALLLTGDLVDAKTRAEGSQQHPEEWQSYERAWRHLAASAGLAASGVLDLRGNHCAFDTLRGSDQDYFCQHSATAAAHGQLVAARQRIKVTHLLPQLLLLPAQEQQQQQGAQQAADTEHEGDDADDDADAAGRRLRATQQLSHGSSRSSLSGSTAAGSRVLTTPRAAAGGGTAAAAVTATCPMAVLLGLDLAPNIGLYGPANFFGIASNDFLSELQQTLQQLGPDSSSSHSQLQQQYACSSRGGGGMLAATPIISYSHYPFSTVAGGWTGSPYRNPSSSTGERHGAVVVDEDSFADAAAAEAAAAAARGLGEAGRALSRLLGRYDVTAHLSGHLHDLMGPHMYTKYAKQRSGVSPPTFLADLEAADWKSARRWRLAAVDSGTFSFADLTFEQQQPTQQQGGSSKSNSKQRHSRQQPVLLPQQHASSSSGGGATAAGSSSGYRVMSVEGSRLVGGHVVLLTWPPDGRYSPWQSSQPPLQVERGSADGSSSGKGVAVRALVVPMNTAAAAGGGGANSSSAADTVSAVTMTWSCVPRTHWSQHSSSSSSANACGSRHMLPIGTPAADAPADASDQAGSSSSSSVPVPWSAPPYRLTSPQVFGLEVPLSHVELAHCCGTLDSSSSGGEQQVTAGGEFVLQLQVTVEEGAPVQAAAGTGTAGVVVSRSTSELRPVRLLLPSWGAAGEQQQQQQGPLPLPSNPAEVFFLRVDGSLLARWMFYSCWALQMAALLLSRVFNRQLLAVRSRRWYSGVAAAVAAVAQPPPSTAAQGSSSTTACGSVHYSSSSSLLYRGTQQQQQQLHDSGSRADFTATISSSNSSGCTAKAPRCRPFGSWVVLLLLLLLRLVLLLLAGVKRLLLAACALLLLPLVGLALVAAHHPGPWKLLLVHAAYQVVGPWFGAQLSSYSPGLGLWFPYGLLLPLPGSVPRVWETGGVGSGVTAAAAGVSGGGWEGAAAGEGVWWGFVRSADARFIAGLSMMGVLCPVSLWLGMLVGSWYLQRAAAAADMCESVLGLDGGEGGYGPKGRQDVSSAEFWGDQDSGVLTAQGFVITAARSSSLSNRQSPGGGGPAAYFGSRQPAAAAAGDEECLWQVMPLAEGEEEGEGDSALGGSCQLSNTGHDLHCELVPLKQQQQQHNRGSVTSPPRRRKDIAAAVDESAAAAADDDNSRSNGRSRSRQQQQAEQQQQQQQSSTPSAAAAAAAAVLLRGASQVLLLPVMNSLLPVSGSSSSGPPTMSSQQPGDHQEQYVSPTAAAGGGGSSSRPSLTVLPHTSVLWRVPVLSRGLHCIQCGVLWVRAGLALLQVLAAATPLPSLPLLLLLLAGPAGVWVKANYRLAAAYGPAGVLLSPVLGWLPALVAVWCHTVRKQMGVVDTWGMGTCCTKGAWRMRTE